MRRKAAVKTGRTSTNDFDTYPVFGDPASLKKVTLSFAFESYFRKIKTSASISDLL